MSKLLRLTVWRSFVHAKSDYETQFWTQIITRVFIRFSFIIIVRHHNRHQAIFLKKDAAHLKERRKPILSNFRLFILTDQTAMWMQQKTPGQTLQHLR